MGQTLWQRLVRGPERVEFYNPAHAKVGSTFSMDVMGLRGLIFTLREIHEYKRVINGNTLLFADYVLLARPIDKEDVEIRVRFVPAAKPDAATTHDVLILSLYDEMKFCKELDDALRDTTGELVITENDVEERYWRLNDLTTSYNAEVSVFRDDNGDGRVQGNEVRRFNVEYWDFSRETEDEAKQKLVQFLFVEMDKDNGMQTMWRGEEVDPQRVTVL